MRHILIAVCLLSLCVMASEATDDVPALGQAGLSDASWAKYPSQSSSSIIRSVANRSNPLLYKELELLLRSHEGTSWPSSRCAESAMAFALNVTSSLGVSPSAFTVVVKVFDTVVTLVNTTGLVKYGTSQQLNATEVAEYIVNAVTTYNTSKPSNDAMAHALGEYFVGRCNISGAALNYHPVTVPNYLNQPVQYSRTAFWALGGLAGLCIVLQAGYGLYHGKAFDMIVLRDAD